MARGKASSRSLASIVAPLKGYLALWKQSDHKMYASVGAASPTSSALPRQYGSHGTPTPALLQVAALRGEGVLRSHFFGKAEGQFLARLPIAPTDAQLLEYWQSFVENRGQIADFARRLGLVAELATSITVPAQQDNEWCYTVYLIFLDHLSQQAKLPALELAIGRFFYHLWRQKFPVAFLTPEKPKRPSASAIHLLAEKCHNKLRKQHGSHAALRESFKEQLKDGEKLIRFLIKIQTAPQAPWQEITAVEHRHLSMARYLAYSETLEKISVMTEIAPWTPSKKQLESDPD